MDTILILDDSKSLLQMMKAVFELNNYEVRTSPTRSSLLAHLEIFKPDIILMDVLLKESNGRNICRELKERDETGNIPIILISADQEQLRSYNECLADDIIEKPFEFEDIDRKIKAVLEKRSSGRSFRAVPN